MNIYVIIETWIQLLNFPMIEDDDKIVQKQQTSKLHMTPQNFMRLQKIYRFHEYQKILEITWKTILAHIRYISNGSAPYVEIQWETPYPQGDAYFFYTKFDMWFLHQPIELDELYPLVHENRVKTVGKGVKSAKYCENWPKNHVFS